MIQNVIDGFHSTIFCYGQTGSGKTYTMDGYYYRKSERGVFLPVTDDRSTKGGTQHGLIQRSIQKLIEKIQPLRSYKNVQMNVSFLQIYNEKIYDLLNPGMFKRAKGEGLQ